MARKRKFHRGLILSGGGARGAYQVGVWKYLQELGWKPDLICGTSVGAVNSAAIGCGLNLEEMISLWKTIERGRIYKLSLWRQLVHTLTRRGYAPLMDTEPFKNLLLEKLDISRLRRSEAEIIITAVNILKSQLKFFSHRVIDIEHVMASSAIPILFPWQYIDGEPYWDGGIMANTPIQPALERGCKEILVVLLSPVGGSRLSLPNSRRQGLERVFEMSLIGSYESYMAHLSYEYKLRSSQSLMQRFVRRTLTLGDIKIATVAPVQMLGFQSILNFSARQADMLIHEGYQDARNQLAEFFGLEETPY
ncbi:MAG: patatin-like phospholipase family protein [Spirochaetia bacterium]|nr:patatin-like phospholipase family protein [Spirochaetia bacterium]